MSSQLNQQIAKLGEIISFTSEVEKIVHLQDIDEMWDSIELHSGQLSELKKQTNKINSSVQINKENTDTDIQILAKKIKYAYILAGGSLGLAIIELIIIISKGI